MNLKKNLHIDSLNNFEKVIKENCINMIVQNVLDVEQMIDDDLRLLTITPIEIF
jgi:hypothetical protein